MNRQTAISPRNGEFFGVHAISGVGLTVKHTVAETKTQVDSFLGHCQVHRLRSITRLKKFFEI